MYRKTSIKTFLGALFLMLTVAACNPSFKITGYKYQNLSIDQKTDSVADTRYIDLLKPYSKKLDSELSEIIAFADTSLVSYRPESPLSNFISDLLLAYGQTFANENHPGIQLDFSLANNGGLRTSIPAGEISVRNVFELLPFENELVLLSINGDQLVELANHIAFRGGEGVSGISFGLKNGKATNILLGGKKIDPNANYWLITNDYIANGGDGMKILTQAAKRIETGEKIRDVVIRRLKQMTAKGQHINAKIDGRIYNAE